MGVEDAARYIRTIKVLAKLKFTNIISVAFMLFLCYNHLDRNKVVMK